MDGTLVQTCLISEMVFFSSLIQWFEMKGLWQISTLTNHQDIKNALNIKVIHKETIG